MNLLVLNDYGITGGGTEKRIKLLIDELIKRRFFRKIFIIQKFGRDVATKNFQIFTCQNNVMELTQKILNEEDIDLVQAHNLMALGPEPILVAKKFQKTVIWFAHDYWVICGKRSFIDPYNASKERLCGKAYNKLCFKCLRPKTYFKIKYQKRIINKVDLAIAPGKILQNIYEYNGVLNGKWKIITPWLDTNKFKEQSIKKREQSILFVGSLIDFKGGWVAVKALKYVSAKIPNVKLKFIGDGQEKESIFRKRIEKIAIANTVLKNIQFLGKKDWNFIKKEHDKAGVYICPTVCMESFGLNWAEALTSGCPVIASRIGSIPEFLEGKTVLVTPRDEKELGLAIIRVLTDKGLANSLAKKGRDYAVQTFDTKRAVDELRNIYGDILKNAI